MIIVVCAHIDLAQDRENIVLACRISADRKLHYVAGGYDVADSHSIIYRSSIGIALTSRMIYSLYFTIV